jgi:hypothetical protein
VTRELCMAQADIGRIADSAIANPYTNPLSAPGACCSRLLAGQSAAERR